MLVGSETNGKKPYVTIHTGILAQPVAVYLGTTMEAKSSGKPLTPSRADTADFDQPGNDIRTINQAMTELMAVSELATFPDSDVPIVNIL